MKLEVAHKRRYVDFYRCHKCVAIVTVLEGQLAPKFCTWCGAERDDCDNCHGERGGVAGNENIVDNKILCDYCAVERQKSK